MRVRDPDLEPEMPPPEVEDASHSGSGKDLRSRISTARAYSGTDWDSVKRTSTALVGTAVVWIAFAIATPTFLTHLNISGIFVSASNIAVIGAGLTVALIAAEIDLSVGSVEGLTSALLAVLLIKDGWPPAVGIIAALAIGGFVGVINGTLTWHLKIPSFIATLAMMGIAQGVAYLLTAGEPLTGLPDSVIALGSGHVIGIPAPVIIAIGVVAATHLILRRLQFGRHVFAVGGDHEAARLMGVNVGRTKILALGLSGLTASIGGLILAARLNGGSGDFGQNDILSAVAAAVIGGTSLFGGVGSVVGTAIGAVLVATITDGLVLLNVAAFWQEIAVGVIVLAAMVVNRAVASDMLTAGLPMPQWLRLSRRPGNGE
jgi:ribose/xylose/arabinose/galactoside ABC-type transport system permease subunit